MPKVSLGHFGGKLTPEQVLTGALQDVGELTALVMVVKTNDGLVLTQWSSGCMDTERLGMLDVGRDTILRKMRGELDE